ncbi:MAG TPA: mannose-6-phosphate isomerase, class I [Chitinophagaceae bacterium]|nr:mannose-6-phosphate isomerase, class I [Chitinophagaceae bacterium]
MHTQPAVYKLKGIVQPYAWGGFQFIPNLLGKPETNTPSAEYWLGAHPLNPAEIDVHGILKKLNQFIEEDKEGVLGHSAASAFGGLPYLLKLLDVRQMLSIQVHPGKAAAAAAFNEENQRGIALNATNRNYKDANHKPELMVALGDFWLLHGFKPAEQLKETLASIPDFAFLIPVFETKGYKGLYETVMTLPQDEVNDLLQPFLQRLLPLYQNGELPKNTEDFWAARAAQTFCKTAAIDRGIFSIYFFNLVHLKKGEGIYQPAGLPHAYLEGKNVEIMATSDNVLRAGLTDKHIDIAELMKHVQFEETIPNVLHDTGGRETVYKSEAAEFSLSRIQLEPSDTIELTTQSGEIIIALEGKVHYQYSSENGNLQRGEAVFITNGTTVTFTAEAPAQLFRALVPTG